MQTNSVDASGNRPQRAITMATNLTLCLFLALAGGALPAESASTIGLDEIDLSGMTAGTGRGSVLPHRSVANKPLSIAGQVFENGVGTHAVSTLILELNGGGETIQGKAGVDDAAKAGASIRFYLIGDRRVLWDSGVMHRGDVARSFEAKLAGIRKVGLLVTDAGDGTAQDLADWVDVDISYQGEVPYVPNYFVEAPYLLTPPAPVGPHINGPKIYGVRPGSPFRYRIPCTGERPIKFSAQSLPPGLTLDDTSGIITGIVPDAGTYRTTLQAKNRHGSTAREFKIVVGDTLMLTPAMGWNSWYIHKRAITDAIMRQAADLMITTGMADYGYEYVNVDDCWMVLANSEDPVLGGTIRDEGGKLRSNRNFPGMKALADYIHAQGLKAGLYSSPGPTTCGGFAGSYQHEAEDARTFAEWGFDLLKYDWCSYEKVTPDYSLKSLQAPFRLMRDELRQQNRDIAFNLCQYGMGQVWTWAGEIGESWRTTGDIAWMRGMAMPAFYYIGRSNADHWQYAKPGNWNDPDYILMGSVRDPFKQNQIVKADLSPSEHFSYMSMWSLMAAPLIFSGDMASVDEFLRNVLCNHEVIDLNQDPLGRQARIVREGKCELVMVKELEGGAKAVGLFHITGPTKDPTGFPLQNERRVSKVAPASPDPEVIDPASYLNWGEAVTISVSAAELGLTGSFKVRDVWRQKELGEFTNSFTASVPFHGVSLLRISH